MKTKSSIWLGLCTLVLCLGVMITGVYSALSASLNLNGTLGFNMHNATVTVQGSIQNVAESNDNWATATPITKTIERTIMGGEEQTTTNLDLENLYFYAGSNMIFTFTFTNISETAIQATFPLPTVGTGVTILTGTVNGYTEFTDGVYTTTIAVDSSETVFFALSMQNATLGANVTFNWNNIELEEYIQNGYTVTFLSTDFVGVSELGTYFYYSINGEEYIYLLNTNPIVSNVFTIQFLYDLPGLGMEKAYYSVWIGEKDSFTDDNADWILYDGKPSENITLLSDTSIYISFTP